MAGTKPSFSVMASTLFNRPRADRCEAMIESGPELVFNFGPDHKQLHLAIVVNLQSHCYLVAKQLSMANQQKLQEWREVDRRDVFKDFERRHANKFAFLYDEQQQKSKEWLLHRPQEILSEPEQARWKQKYTEMKSRHDKKLRLFQKMSKYTKEDIDNIEDLDSKPFLMEILKLINNGEIAKQKKEQIELTGMAKARYEFEKKKLNKQIINYLRQIFMRRKYIDFWSREFIILVGFVSILEQVLSRFFYLKEFRDKSRKQMIATLFAVSRVKSSMESRGSTNKERTATESKM